MTRKKRNPRLRLVNCVVDLARSRFTSTILVEYYQYRHHSSGIERQQKEQLPKETRPVSDQVAIAFWMSSSTRRNQEGTRRANGANSRVNRSGREGGLRNKGATREMGKDNRRGWWGIERAKGNKQTTMRRVG